jgi:YVTN family beta-propeller protein
MKYLTNCELRIDAPRRKSRGAAWLAAAVLFAAVAWPAQAQRPANSGEPFTGLINPSAVAFNPATGKVYTVNPDANAVEISDDAANSTVRIQVGAGPVSIAADSTNGRAYVVNADDGTVSVIDGKTDAVIATLPIGGHPYSIAADSAAGKIYVSRTYGDQLAIIDAATNQIGGVKTGSPDLIAVNPQSHIAYLLGYEGGSVAMFDEATQSIASKLSVGMHAWGMALDDVTGVVYIAKIGDSSVAVLDPGAATPKLIRTGFLPCSVAVNSRTHTVYIANYGDNSLTVIDGAKGRVVATIPVGNRPQSVAVDSVRNLVYVANTLANSVTVIDGASNHAIATLDAGKAPYALAVNATSGKLHVANLNRTSFTILDASHTQRR